MSAAARPGRGGQGDLGDAGRLGGDDVHDHTGRVGAEAARDVHAGPAQGHEPLDQADPGPVGPDQVGRALGPVEGAGPLDRVQQRRAQVRAEGGLGGGQLVGGGPPGPRRCVDPVEAPGRLGDRGVAAGGHVGDQVAHPGPGRLDGVGGGAGQQPGRVAVGASQVDDGQHGSSLHTAQGQATGRDSPYRSPRVAGVARGLWTAQIHSRPGAVDNPIHPRPGAVDNPTHPTRGLWTTQSAPAPVGLRSPTGGPGTGSGGCGAPGPGTGANRPDG
jgi:hypothetical protein